MPDLRLSHDEAKDITAYLLTLKNDEFNEIESPNYDKEEMTNINKNIMWDYIQTLFVIGETIISDSKSIKKLVENFKN